ncbi:MAG: GNAT family N-acetyltransferase [Verrucomicrobiota bacterium]|nr:GNAT family N-acetyltransferase [Verrucomicrobiota bacterium]
MPDLKTRVPKMLAADQFIGDILGKPTWCVTEPDEVTPELFRAGPDGFAYAKVDCADIAAINVLEKSGFNLIDTNTQFDRSNSEPWPEVELPSDYSTRFAEPADAKNVEEVAATSFVYTRFHLDSLIPDEMANKIKSHWAGNFFTGERGDWMVVLTYCCQTVGFLQLLSKNDTIVIDLIAVDKAHQGKGLAAGMIEFAAKQCGEWSRMLVGTQISNISSMRAYEKLGFRMCDSSYVFHYHGPVMA